MDFNIICDSQQWFESHKFFHSEKGGVRLSSDSKRGNVYLALDDLAWQLGCELDPISQDLCEIAAYVYMADKAIPRGEFDNWARDLSFLVPVSDPDKWDEVRGLLINTIAWLTGDNVQFHFIKRKREHLPVERVPEFNNRYQNRDLSDSICLFSGGLDSFAGAVYLIQEGKRPLFMSHYANALLKNLQSNLINGIHARSGVPFEHLQYRVTSRKLQNTEFIFKAKESSHRARSFLFMSFGAVAAALRGLSDIYICENGVLAINVPISEARKGSRSTRHAHPLYLSYFNSFINQIYGRTFAVQNPFLFWTKGEEAKLLNDNGFIQMVRNTVSCWGYPNQTIRYKNSNHCGHCIPCIVRRVSLAATDLERYDDKYILDVFALGKKIKQEQSRNITDLIYFCQCIKSRSIIDLLYRYPEFLAIEAHQDRVSRDNMVRIINVYKEFARQVLEVAQSHSFGKN